MLSSNASKAFRFKAMNIFWLFVARPKGTHQEWAWSIELNDGDVVHCGGEYKDPSPCRSYCRLCRSRDFHTGRNVSMKLRTTKNLKQFENAPIAGNPMATKDGSNR